MYRSRRNGWGEMDDLFGPGLFGDMAGTRGRRRPVRTRRPEEPDDPEERLGLKRVIDGQPEPAGDLAEPGEPEPQQRGDRERLRQVTTDFVNYKRRVEREREEQARSANRELIVKVLPVLDDLRRAVGSVPDDAADADWVKGLSLIERKLEATLGEEGLERMAAEGKEFDPQEHEAILCEEDAGTAQETVKSVIRDGYRLHGKVIRPAQVVVSKPKEEPVEPAGYVRVRPR